LENYPSKGLENSTKIDRAKFKSKDRDNICYQWLQKIDLEFKKVFRKNPK